MLPNFLSRTFLAFFAFLIVGVSSPSFAGSKWVNRPLPTVRHLDESAALFQSAVQNISNAKECLPIFIQREGQLNILYHHCSKEAFASEMKPMPLQGSFQVPDGLALRFNFWRRIYSLWTSEQYVLHVADYPEVIFEIADISQADPTLGNMQKQNIVKRIMRVHRDDFRRLLMTMHNSRHKDPALMTPAMRRLADLLAHISDPNKYLVAARSIRMQRGQRDYIAKGFESGSRYMTAIREEFVKEGVPTELANLAYIESSFNIQAYSKVGAAGVYQLMPSTAKQYMKVGTEIDERRDPIKSARAAAKLLKLYYAITGNWALATTAYNHGVGGIKQAVKATGSTSIEHLVHHYEGRAFGFASKNFYSGFLAMLATIQNAKTIFPEVVAHEAIRFQAIRLTQPISTKMVMQRYGLTPDILIQYNPDIARSMIRFNGILPRNYEIKVPSSEVYMVDVKSQLGKS